MIRETVSLLNAEVQQARRTLGLSQNEFARRAGVDQSILSRLLAGKLTSEPATKKIRAYLARVRRRLVASEQVS